MRRWSLCIAVILVALTPGCEGPSATIVLGPLPQRPVIKALDGDDAGVEFPAGATRCHTSADCDDGIDCTQDDCVDPGYCSNTLVNARCGDGTICNGAWSCDPKRGCVQAPAPTCDDLDPCTVDHCDEDMKQCLHDPRDFDHDGEVDDHCSGGTDCDDFDPDVGTHEVERCRDGIDNDCDGAIDEADCESIPHDNCSDPDDISAGGTFEVPVIGATRDEAVSCSETPNASDVTFRFTLTEHRDVALTATGELPAGGSGAVSLSLRSSCTDGASELQCAHGDPTELRRRAVPAGDYFVIGSFTSGASSLVLRASFDPPTTAPTNQSCEHALDVSAGGQWTGDFVGVGDVTMSSCAIMGQPDLFYALHLDESKDVSISALALEDGTQLVASLRKGCDASAELQGCQIGYALVTHYHQLSPGDYVLVLEGPTTRPTGFTLDVSITPPTPPPAGDNCLAPATLTFGKPQTLSLIGFQDDVNSSCQRQGAPDAVLAFTLDKSQDLDFEVESDDNMAVAMALQKTCGDPTSEQACQSGAPLTTRMHDVAAGQYFLVLDSPAATMLTITANAQSATPITPVSGDDTCASAFVIPANGGVFQGDTRGLADDYHGSCGGSELSPDAAFQLTLTDRKHVVARVDSSFDSVLLRFDPPAAGAMPCSDANPACNDDGATMGTNPELDETLDPGTYYYIVDGYGLNDSGTYALDVSVSAP